MRARLAGGLLAVAPLSILFIFAGVALVLAGGSQLGGIRVSAVVFAVGMILNGLTILTTPIGIWLTAKNLARANYELPRWKLYAVAGIFLGPLIGTLMWFRREGARREIKQAEQTS